MTEKHSDNRSLTKQSKMKESPEKLGCFGLSRLVASRQNRQDEFEELLNSSRYQQLEQLYYSQVQRHNQPKFTNVLVQILQIQEVQSIQEYTVNGSTFKVHVIEDTEL